MYIVEFKRRLFSLSFFFCHPPAELSPPNRGGREAHPQSGARATAPFTPAAVPLPAADTPPPHTAGAPGTAPPCRGADAGGSTSGGARHAPRRRRRASAVGTTTAGRPRRSSPPPWPRAHAGAPLGLASAPPPVRAWAVGPPSPLLPPLAARRSPPARHPPAAPPTTGGWSRSAAAARRRRLASKQGWPTNASGSRPGAAHTGLQ